MYVSFSLLSWGVVLALFLLLVKYKNVVLEALSSVDIQLKKRHDMIPNLVSTAKGYMSHEKSLLEEITKIRSFVSKDYDPKSLWGRSLCLDRS